MNQQTKFVAALAAICAVFWTIAAIHPVDRQAWILENLLLVLFVFALSLTHQHLQLSNASYIFIALFVILHTIGAHYTYAKMPVGLWAKDFFGFSRNHADRVAHFGFGFFLAFPLRELLLRFGGIRRGWSFWLPPAIILAISGFFEILEGIIAQIVRPDLGIAYLGTQGDIWDAQKDMAAAFLGAILTAVLLSLRHARR